MSSIAKAEFNYAPKIWIPRQVIITPAAGGLKLSQPIPPSADWQFHIALGCPAHCQYCYLVGSLPGPPVTRVYANLPEILDELKDYLGSGTVTSQSAERSSEGTTFFRAGIHRLALKWTKHFARLSAPNSVPKNSYIRSLLWTQCEYSFMMR